MLPRCVLLPLLPGPCCLDAADTSWPSLGAVPPAFVLPVHVGPGLVLFRLPYCCQHKPSAVFPCLHAADACCPSLGVVPPASTLRILVAQAFVVFPPALMLPSELPLLASPALGIIPLLRCCHERLLALPCCLSRWVASWGSSYCKGHRTCLVPACEQSTTIKLAALLGLHAMTAVLAQTLEWLACTVTKMGCPNSTSPKCVDISPVLRLLPAAACALLIALVQQCHHLFPW